MKAPRIVAISLVAATLGVGLGGTARAQQSAKVGPITVSLWAPEGVTKLRGILAFSSVGAGVGWGTSADFRALATKLQAGVVNIRGENPFGDASYPTRCAKGEFKVLLDALTELGKVSNHPELANAPIVGSGHSHGGDYWNYFNACYPERMALIFCKSSGGVQYSKGALRTPMIWEIGTNDVRDSRGFFRGAMLAHRAAGTAMTLVMGQGESHGSFTAGPRKLVIDLIEAIFKLRVPAEADPAAGPVTLYDLDEKTGAWWLGDNYAKTTAPFAMSPAKDNLPRTSFLPTEALAEQWKMTVAALPEAVKMDSGTCSSCYKPLATEPVAKPLNPAPGTGGTPAAPPDAGAPADSAPTTPDPPTMPAPPDAAAKPPVTPPARDAAPVTPPPDEVEDPPATSARAPSGGCAMTGSVDAGAASAWLLALALALGAPRRRR